MVFKSVLLVLSALVLMTTSQKFLPKTSSYLPMDDLFTVNVARSGRDSFWKTQQNGAQTVISAFPVIPNVVTKVTFYMENGNGFNFACGQKDAEAMRKYGNTWNYPNTVLYHPPNGRKYINMDPNGIEYGSTAMEGDNITMTIDLRPYHNEVSYAKNGLPMGIAFSGLNNWGQNIYIMVTIHSKDHRFKIIDYTVEQ